MDSTLGKFILVLLLSAPLSAVAGGVVNSCTEADLRAALAGGGMVTFACDGVITVTNTITITDNTVIDGSSRDVAISGGNAVRVLSVSSGVELTLIHVTVSSGFSSNAFGVGILNLGAVTATACMFTNNRTAGNGGAIANGSSARLRLNRCSFIGNSATSYGGAISDITLAGPHVITNCTFAYNVAPRGAAIGTACASDATDYMVNCTFFGNTGNAVENMGTKAPVMINSIVAGTTGAGCAGGISDGGYNLSSDGSCNLTNIGSMQGVDPQLAPFGNYGGPTETFVLIQGSPAIDAANTAAGPSVDQRGQPRPAGTATDIGAFEGSVPVQGIVQFEFVSYITDEDDPVALLSVIRGGDTNLSGTISFATVAGTATAGADYIETNGVISFAPGETRDYVAIPLLNDTLHEIPETFQVVLSNPTGGLWLMGRTNATVTINDDDVTVVTDCTDAGLRQALSQGGTIRFSCDGMITLTNTLVITNNTAIDSGGRDVTISGGNAVRAFAVSSNVQVNITALKIVDCRHTNEGAGVLNLGALTMSRCVLSNNVANDVNGGALLNNGRLTAVGCTFVSNRAEGGSGVGGGAIYNRGLFSISGCTFARNVAAYGGGAIYHYVSGGVDVQVGITNCSFSNNRSTFNSGGAIYNNSFSFIHHDRLSIVNCTFADNGGGAVDGPPQHPTWIANSIIGAMGAFQDGGNNLYWGNGGDPIDLRLGPLQDNGGPTWTMALQPDSPAIDQGNSAYCPTTDQRGIARPYGPRCDIGAYEATVPPTPAFFQFSDSAFNTSEAAGTATVSVVRVGSSAGAASVRYSSSDGTALAFYDYVVTSGTLNFANGQTQATFTVSIKDDVVPESNETINLTLSNPTGGPSLGSPATAALTVTDNDPVQPGSLSFMQPAYSVAESSGEARVWVTRTGGTNGVVTVNFATTDGSAIAGVDYVTRSGTLTFADGETAQQIVVQLLGDAAIEPAKTFTLALSVPTGGVTIGIPASTTVTIMDQRSTVAGCDEAALRAAVAAGGTVVLACNGTIVLSSPLVVSNGTVIDAANYNPTLSGGNATRLFNVNPGVNLTLLHVTLADGLARGTNGNTGQPGGSGDGGAIYNNGGTLSAISCAFLRNKGEGGTGGNNSGFFGQPGSGGVGRGGAIFNLAGVVTLAGCALQSNQTHGGTAGAAQTGAFGGASAGGAIYSTSGHVEISDCALSGNLSLAGRGTRINGSLGGSGLASGGALEFDSGTVTISRSVFAMK